MEQYTKAQKELAGALIGLSKALDEANSSYYMFNVIMESLQLLRDGNDFVISKQTGKVHETKMIAVPDCSVCQNPCGRTADYNMDELDNLNPKTAMLKYELLDKICEYAGNISFTENDYKGLLDILCGSLFAVGYDGFTDEQLTEKIESYN